MVKTTHAWFDIKGIVATLGVSLKVETLTCSPPSAPPAGAAFSGRPGRDGEAAYIAIHYIVLHCVRDVSMYLTGCISLPVVLFQTA